MELETLDLFLKTCFAQFRKDIRACLLCGPMNKIEERIEELANHYELRLRAGIAELIIDNN